MPTLCPSLPYLLYTAGISMYRFSYKASLEKVTDTRIHVTTKNILTPTHNSVPITKAAILAPESSSAHLVH